MKKEKLKLEYIFYILMAILIGLFLYWLFHDDKGTQWNVFFRKTSDYFADYINVLRYSAWHDPYFNALNGPSEKGYFPLTYLIFYWLAKAVNFAEYRDDGVDVGMWTTNLTIANYVMLLMILIMFIQLFQMKKGKPVTKWLMTLALAFSGIALFSYERGNVIYLAVIGMVCFIEHYQSENKVLREWAFIALAFAAAIKGYPAIFGILLIWEKRWKEAIRLMIYGLLFCFGPFALIGTGFKYNITQWLVNLGENGEKYMFTHNPRFGYLFFLSQMKSGDTRDMWNEVLKIIFYILAIIGIIVISRQKTWWKKAAMLVSIIILLPTNSGFYCGLYPVSYTHLERTGIELDSILSSQLLINIFEKNTPLHDGAIIVRGNRVVAATCYLPLSDNLALSKDLGTRHRAAVGISEVSDSMTIVVSEETGKVSLAVEGELYRNIDEEFLKKKLSEGHLKNVENGKIIDWKRRLQNVKKAKEPSDK